MTLGTEIKPPKDAAAFEARVLDLWARTRLPLTRANIIAATGAPRAKADVWLEAMVRGDLLELDSDDDGEMLWVVRGTKRPVRGLETLGDVRRMQSASHDADIVVSRGSTALATRGAGAALAKGGEKKSVVASGLLSFVLGPFGLLYAAPLKVALPAVLAWILACSIIPKFILIYAMGVISPVCAILGVLYALGYNVAGERVTLFGKDGKEPKRLR